MEITEIKQRLSIETVLSCYHLVADKRHQLLCPFHEETTPSLTIYPTTGTFHCFGCGKSGDVIEFIQLKENISKHEAIIKAGELAGGLPALPNTNAEIKRMPEAPTLTPQERTALLTRLFGYFVKAAHNSPPARAYMESRKLERFTHPIGYNSGQFHHGERKDMHLISQCLSVGLLIDAGLTNNRTGEKAYKTFGKEAIVFPLKDKEDQIVSLYFRGIEGHCRHFYLKNRQGLYPGYPKPETTKLILTEAIIDAVTLLQVAQIAEDYSVLACYGTNGLTTEHIQAIHNLPNLQEIILFFDGDKAGREAIPRVANQLKTDNITSEISYIETPENEDINSLLQAHAPGIFAHLLKMRKPVAALFLLPEKEILPEKTENKPLPENTNLAHNTSILDTPTAHHQVYITPTARYHIHGGLKTGIYDSLKISLRVEHPVTGKDYRGKVDLYEHKQVQAIARDAAERLCLEAKDIETDMHALTTHLEIYRDHMNDKQVTTPVKPVIEMDSATAQKCGEFLRNPHLLQNINQLIERSGITGEESTRLLLFTVATTYKSEEPLHALVQGSSGSGKTHLVLKTAALMPPEDVITLTRVTESSFYNYGEDELVGKLICLEDIDGLKEEALLAFRELISRRELNSSTTVKDESGHIRAVIKRVRGEFASMSATTHGEIYEDNMGRCLVVAVDESREQTLRVIEAQNKRAAGQSNTAEESRAATFLQHCMRMLKPVDVVNPYAHQVQLPPQVHKIRRLNELYQSFVKQITVIHQYQRKTDEKGRLVSQKEDLQAACDILFESIVLKVDELDGSLRQFYEQLKGYVMKQENPQKYEFTRLETRQHIAVGKTQQHNYINRLIELEYIVQSGGHINRGLRYKINYWDNMEVMREKIKAHLYSQLEKI